VYSRLFDRRIQALPALRKREQISSASENNKQRGQASPQTIGVPLKTADKYSIDFIWETRCFQMQTHWLMFFAVKG
jgi:hypothetical protein